MTHIVYTRAALAVNPIVWHWGGMAREDPHFRLRIPESLKAQVEKAASANKRSMTAEMIARLEDSFRELPDYASLAARLEETDRRLRVVEEFFGDIAVANDDGTMRPATSMEMLRAAEKRRG